MRMQRQRCDRKHLNVVRLCASLSQHVLNQNLHEDRIADVFLFVSIDVSIGAT
jgi:hypothetical protein